MEIQVTGGKNFKRTRMKLIPKGSNKLSRLGSPPDNQ